MSRISDLYEKDYHAWLNINIENLKQGRVYDCDIEHIIEELESMGNRDIRELYSRVIILIAHLLKCEYQPQLISSSWLGTIKEQRRQIKLLLAGSPSLKNKIEGIVSDSKVLDDAIDLFVTETGLKPFAVNYTVDQLLDSGFIPNKM